MQENTVLLFEACAVLSYIPLFFPCKYHHTTRERKTIRVFLPVRNKWVSLAYNLQSQI